jgi:hypothetical protein
VQGSYTGQVTLERIGIGAVEILEQISAEVGAILSDCEPHFP